MMMMIMMMMMMIMMMMRARDAHGGFAVVPRVLIL